MKRIFCFIPAILLVLAGQSHDFLSEYSKLTILTDNILLDLWGRRKLRYRWLFFEILGDVIPEERKDLLVGFNQKFIFDFDTVLIAICF